jgi:hypothetical protein
VAFPPVPVGSAATASLSVRNIGKSNLSVRVGTLTAPFTVTRGAGSYTLGPGVALTVSIRFAPTSRTAIAPRTVVVSAPSSTPSSASIRVSGSVK